MPYDRNNQAFLAVAFAVLQIVLLLVVYAFVYTSALVVRQLVERGETHAVAFVLPFGIALLLPYAFWRFRRMFAADRRMEATAWSFASAAAAIVILSVFSVRLAGV